MFLLNSVLLLKVEENLPCGRYPLIQSSSDLTEQQPELDYLIFRKVFCEHSLGLCHMLLPESGLSFPFRCEFYMLDSTVIPVIIGVYKFFLHKPSHDSVCGRLGNVNGSL